MLLSKTSKYKIPIKIKNFTKIFQLYERDYVNLNIIKKVILKKTNLINDVIQIINEFISDIEYIFLIDKLKTSNYIIHKNEIFLDKDYDFKKIKFDESIINRSQYGISWLKKIEGYKQQFFRKNGTNYILIVNDDTYHYNKRLNKLKKVSDNINIYCTFNNHNIHHIFDNDDIYKIINEHNILQLYQNNILKNTFTFGGLTLRSFICKSYNNNILILCSMCDCYIVFLYDTLLNEYIKYEYSKLDYTTIYDIVLYNNNIIIKCNFRKFIGENIIKKDKIIIQNEDGIRKINIIDEYNSFRLL